MFEEDNTPLYQIYQKELSPYKELEKFQELGWYWRLSYDRDSKYQVAIWKYISPAEWAARGGQKRIVKMACGESVDEAIENLHKRIYKEASEAVK